MARKIATIKEKKENKLEEKMYLDCIMSSMMDALIVVNLDATIRSVNKAVLDLLDYQEDELIGQPVKKIFLQEEKILQVYFESIVTVGSTYNISLTCITKQGEAIPVNFKCGQMLQDNKVIGIVGVARDMRQTMAIIKDLEENKIETEERNENLIRMRRAMLHMMGDLQEVSRIRMQFTGMVSHELRTPLAVIKEVICIVLNKLIGDINEEQGKYLNMAKNNVDRLDRLITAVLDFQKLEARKMEFKIENSDINEIVKSICNAMVLLSKEKGLTLEVQLYDNLPQVKLDKDKIIQVLTNLINNALKFTEKGGITVSTNRGDNFIQVMVKDTGIGVEKKDIQKLFQEFTQLQRRVGGTGLGLSICKKIIEAHKGKIWAESEFGKGTAFYFILPIEERRI
ncbi:ATP-binding protein [Candidatus Omnitrophota bacterium]